MRPFALLGAAMTTILLVEDDQGFAPRISDYLGRFGYEVVWATSLGEARSALDAQAPRAAIIDMMLPDGSGIELLETCGERAIPTIVATGHATVEHAVGSLRARAADFLVKPFKLEELKERLDELLRPVSPSTEQGAPSGARRLRVDPDQAHGLGPLVGRSAPMLALYENIRRVAPSTATVLIVGESGTGKELVAQVLHDLSARSDGPFVAVNCGAVAHDLIASELFGHERGSFTGANHQHRGVFEQAAGGTLLLDEITEMPPELQVNLLRVLETGAFRRVGGKGDIRADVRLVAATNRAPDVAMKEKQLREDLFFRLSEFPIEVPPLRERKGDVSLIADHFLEELSNRYETTKRIAGPAYARLEAYDWPGNVRELRNVIHGAYIIGGEEITAADIDGRIRLTSGVRDGSDRIAPGLTIREMERQLILRTLEHFDGNKRQAAQALGVSLKTLYNRLNEYDAEKSRATEE